MTGELLKKFLVGLGFGVDEKELAAFNKAIASATVRVSALYGAVNTMASAIVYGISKVSESFEQLGYEYKIIAPAINKALILRQEMLKAYNAAGVSLPRVVQSAVKLNLSLTKTKYALEAIYKSTASKFFGLLSKQSDLLRAKLYANMPKIIATLERFVKAVFLAFEGLYSFGLRLWSILTRLYDIFVSIDRATNGWSTIILAIAAAWQFLNLQFLMTPLGAILAGLVAILALYDDFMVWKEGGKSFFNWGPVVPYIDSITEAIQQLFYFVSATANGVYNLVRAVGDLIRLDFGAFKERIRSAFDIDTLKFLQGLSVLANPVAEITGRSLNTAALGSQSTNNSSQINQHVNQQTQITVSGVADAQGAGQSVAGQQYNVNRDLVRNLQGAVKPR